MAYNEKEYQKAYYEKNKALMREKYRATREKYYRKNRVRLRERAKGQSTNKEKSQARYRKNKEAILKRVKKYYENNKEVILAKDKKECREAIEKCSIGYIAKLLKISPKELRKNPDLVELKRTQLLGVRKVKQLTKKPNGENKNDVSK